MMMNRICLAVFVLVVVLSTSLSGSNVTYAADETSQTVTAESGAAVESTIEAAAGTAAGSETNASVASTAHTKYVALGDSVTAGYEPGFTEQSVPFGFVDRIYEQALYHGTAELHNYGLIGLTSLGLSKFMQTVANGQKVTKEAIEPESLDPRFDTTFADTNQIKQDIASATLITIMVGGNDFKDFVREHMNKPEEEIMVLAEESINTYIENVKSAIELIHMMNPDAQIAITDQYLPYPKLNKEVYDKLSKVRDSITAAIDALATSLDEEDYDLQVAHIGQLFVGKELSHTYILKTDIHPKQAGYELIAQGLSEQIWGTFNKPQFTNPLALIVGGKELDIPYKPALFNDRTFVPVSEYAVAMGAEVEWDNLTKTATIKLQGKVIQLTMNSETMVVDGAKITIKDKVRLYNNKTYIPLYLMADGLGLDLKYIAQSRTAFLNLK